MDYGIAGRVAVVTGADSGIGLETARLLHAEGARVVISDREQGDLDRSVASLGAGPNLAAFAADVTDTGAVEALRDKVEGRFGPASIVVNCAGITGAQGTFLEIDDAGWMQALDTDLMAAVRVVRAFLPGMIADRWGRVVLIGSEDALQPYVDELPYCVAKAGVLNLAKGLSKGYARHGVLVNAVSPAFIHTPMTDAMMEKRAKQDGTGVDEAIESFLKEERPTLELRRRGEPEEVAAAIAFLCSAQASFIVGTNVRVDGGSVASV